MTDKTKAQQESWVEKVRDAKEQIGDDKATETSRSQATFSKGWGKATKEK